MKASHIFSMAIFFAGTTPAAILVWDGGGGDSLLTTATNWNPNQAPAGSDTLIVNTAATVLYSGNLPSTLTIDLDNGAMLSTDSGAIRLNNANINVGPGAGLIGNFWDLNNADIVFQDGAIASMSNWENKGSNSFTFEFSSTGFTTLTPGTYRNDGNNPASPGVLIDDDAYIVDLTNFAGALGVYTLVDYSGDAEPMDDATFQAFANLSVINSGGYTGTIFWDDATDSIRVLVVPEPTRALLLTLGIATCVFRRRY